ncbi:hypothetical protein Acr_05g0007600 [Actinidia rufa]|uniref:Uncharacterized protein n=1 Tax=Actinidia rufa TaxID=165716 RepID=A0A7J0EKX3_9ERIC|nr:hypothetical protein Acr_05g0007600 [Actinidia rufa]
MSTICFNNPRLTSDRTLRCSPDPRQALLLLVVASSGLGNSIWPPTVLAGEASAISYCVILNNSLLPSLYEAFAIIDGDERRRRLIQASPVISPGSTPITDKMVFTTSSLGPHSSGGMSTYSYCRNIGHIRERCFKLHPELKGTSSKRKWKGPPCTATIVETSLGHVPDLSHIQSQLGLLQSQLGSLLQQQRSGSTATLATGTPTAFHAKTGHPTWVLDSRANDHMTGPDFEEDFWQGI